MTTGRTPRASSSVVRNPSRARCARSEEETGFRCVPGARLPSALYYVDGRRKRVSYWAAEATDCHFTPNREVDHISWLPPDAARARLTQPRDRDLLDALLSALHLA